MAELTIKVDNDELIDQIEQQYNDGDIIDFIATLADRSSWHYHTIRQDIINRLKGEM